MFKPLTEKELKTIYDTADLKGRGIGWDVFIKDPVGSIQQNHPNKQWAKKHRISPTQIAEHFFPHKKGNSKATHHGIELHQRHETACGKYQRMN